VQEYSEGFAELGRTLILFREALDKLGLKRYCCRRMVLTHIDLIEKLLRYKFYYPTWFTSDTILLNGPREAEERLAQRYAFNENNHVGQEGA
jgi:DNA-directed RNA polymerase subunit N (RpoN/RPB10)